MKPGTWFFIAIVLGLTGHIVLFLSTTWLWYFAVLIGSTVAVCAAFHFIVSINDRTNS